MISHPFGDIIMGFQGQNGLNIGQADHVPGDETKSGIGQYNYPYLPYMKIDGNTTLMRSILWLLILSKSTGNGYLYLIVFVAPSKKVYLLPIRMMTGISSSTKTARLGSTLNMIEERL